MEALGGDRPLSSVQLSLELIVHHSNKYEREASPPRAGSTRYTLVAATDDLLLFSIVLELVSVGL